jgi:hypothetical protein
VSPEEQHSDGFFLSYSRSDERIALRIAKDLRDRGIAMWVDQLDIRPSEHWDRAVERAVASCRGLLVILSPRSIASDNVMDEISYAIDSGKSVLPVMIEKCTPPLRLTRMQLVDATGNYERALQQCHDELARRSGSDSSSEERPRPLLDAAEVAKAKRHLAATHGPIAARLVDKAAARAKSTGDLYAILGQHIEDDAERARFLALASTTLTSEPTTPQRTEPAQTPSVDAAAIEAMGRLLTRYIGPIAAFVVKRESRGSQSADELRQQLANHIPDERQRAEFLREAQSR